ncbi:MAG: secretin N-terminal domain-containing protein [Luteolibacter sp.]
MSVPRSIAFLLLGFASAVSAQEPAVAPPGVPVPAVPNPVPTPPPGVPVPGNVPAPAAGAPVPMPMPAPAAVRPALSLGETKITEPIEEPKLSGSALAGLYRKYTGRRVIISSAATTAEFSFIQDASPKDPLSYAQAAELLKKAATIENFVFVPDEQDPNLDILTLSTGGIRPTGRGVAVYNENDTIPEGDAVISYVMNLSYIKPAEAVNTFTQIIGQFGAYGSIAPVPNASAVVITENTSLIRKLIDLKKEIDKPSSQVGTRFIKVQFADVTEIAATLTELLTAQQSAQTTAGIQRADNAPAPVPGAPPVAGGGQTGASSSGESTPVQIIPDPRTNRIFAMGRPVDLLFVEGLVREFDVETSEKNFLRRKLRFLTVSEFLPIAGDALTRAFSGTGESAGGGGASGGATPPGASRNAGAQNTGNNRQNGSTGRSGASSSGSSRSGGSSGFGGSGGSSGFGGGSSGGSGSSSSLDAPSASSAPESKLVGRTLLVADNITNSIVVQGPPSGLEIIERLLDQIDVKPDQVMISTVIGQLTLGNSTETGLDYLFRSNEFAGRGGAGFGALLPILKFFPGSPFIPAIPDDPLTPGVDESVPAVPAVPAQNTPFAPGNLGGGGGLRAYGQIGNLNIYLKALQSKSDFTVLSRPSIFTSNNQKGTISSGERIAIPTGSNTYGGGTGSNTSTQIEYQDVVLKLEVIPLVNSDNEITMQIALLNDEVNGTQTIQGGAGNGQDLSVPKISTREILTTATVPNNNTIVLGGLIISRGGKTKSGIPILGDIPYLGRLFSNTIDTTDRAELMVFIQPTIVNSERSLGNVQADMDNRYKVSGKVREFADGPGVLPPVNAIPIADKASTTHSSTKITTEHQPAACSTMKPSISPIHRQ